jgi:hypothetical protein
MVDLINFPLFIVLIKLDGNKALDILEFLGGSTLSKLYEHIRNIDNILNACKFLYMWKDQVIIINN